jgi:hypothetical protein
MSTSASELFIVDNSDSEWKVRNYLTDWCELSKTIDIATGYFEIGALLALKDKWQQVDSIRLLMGDEVSKRTKRAFEEGLKKIAAMGRGQLEWTQFKPNGPLYVTAVSLVAQLKRRNG